MKYSNELTLRKMMTEASRIPAPVDTGNLKFNGIYSMKTTKGFKIVWDTNFANYITFQNEKWNKGFVERGISNALDVLSYRIQNKLINKGRTKKISTTLPIAVQKGNIINKRNPNGSPIYFTRGQGAMEKQFYRSLARSASNDYGHLEERNREFIYGENGKIIDIIDY